MINAPNQVDSKLCSKVEPDPAIIVTAIPNKKKKEYNPKTLLNFFQTHIAMWTRDFSLQMQYFPI